LDIEKGLYKFLYPKHHNNLFKTKKYRQNMNKIIKILIGLVLVVAPLYLIFPGSCMHSWGIAALDLIKGGITILVLLVGLILIILGIDGLKK
jgi:hypothetical protein